MYELRIFLEKSRNVYRVFKVFPEQTLEDLEDLMEAAFSLSPCLKSEFLMDIRNGELVDTTIMIERQKQGESKQLVGDWLIKRADRLLYVRDEQFRVYIQLHNITQERLQHVSCLAGQGTLLSSSAAIDLTELNQKIKDKCCNVLLKEQLVGRFEQNVVKFETKQMKIKKQLLQVANDLKQLEPWRFFEDYRILALQTLTGEMYFVSMIGHSDNRFGMVIYRRSDYGVLTELLTNNKVTLKDAYTIHFVAFQEVDHSDNEEGIVFQRYEEGTSPTSFNKNDIEILIPVLRAVYQLVCMRKNSQWINTVTRHQCDVATIDVTGGILEIKTVQIQSLTKNEIIIPISETELFEIKRRPSSVLKVEFDMFYLPTPLPTLELEREVLPLSYIVVNCETGQILKREVITFPKDVFTIQHIFWQVISGLQQKPSNVYVDKQIYPHIAELAYRCGIDLQIAELERVEEYKSFMLQTTEWY